MKIVHFTRGQSLLFLIVLLSIYILCECEELSDTCWEHLATDGGDVQRGAQSVDGGMMLEYAQVQKKSKKTKG